MWYLIDVCIKNRTLHDHLEIWNFPSCIEEYFSMLEEKFHLTALPRNILYVFQTKCFIKQVISYFWSVPTCIHLIENLAIVFITHLMFTMFGLEVSYIISYYWHFHIILCTRSSQGLHSLLENPWILVEVLEQSLNFFACLWKVLEFSSALNVIAWKVFFNAF